MPVTSKKKVLFISHEATRTGAPIVLLHLLGWLKNNLELQFEILLLEDGPLKRDFEQLGKTHLLNDLYIKPTYLNRIKKKLLGTTIQDEYKRIVGVFFINGFHLVYGNTIAALPWLKLFKEEHAAKTICCIHELQYALNYFFDNAYLEQNLKPVDLIIAVSKAVKENLINKLNIPEKKIQLHYEFIDTGNQPSINSTSKPDLALMPGEWVIGTGGAPSWRKGTDLLIPLVQSLIKGYPDFKFKVVWLGADAENNLVKQLMHDAEKCGIADKIICLPYKADPINYISLFDVFVLLSREDPFPLIVLEAAFLYKPIIAFENSGGIPEFIEQGAGMLAPYLDTSEIARKVYQLSRDNERKDKIAQKAHELVITKYSSDIIAPEIYRTISSLLTKC